MKILEKLAGKEQFRGVEFFAINAEKNELKNFLHDNPPILILYSKKDLLNPIYFEGEPKMKDVGRFIKSKKDLVKTNNMGEFFSNDL